MLCIHQYSVHILYKPGLELYIVVWLSQNNHVKNRNQEIMDINVNVHVICTAMDIPTSTSIYNKQAAISQDLDLQWLKAYSIRAWPHAKD